MSTKTVRTILYGLMLLFLVGWLLPGPASAADYRKIKIAVLDFQQQGRFEQQDIGKIAAEWLITGLVETGRFDIIERRLLKKILDEQKIGASGLIDPSSASQLGKLLGVKTVVTGTVMKIDDMIEINARLINVETGSIVAAEKVRSEKTEELSELVCKITDKLILAFPLQGYVVERSRGRVIIDIGRQSGLRPGTRFIVYREGKVIKHPKTGEVLDIETIDIGELEVKEVKDKTASCVIVKESRDNIVQYGNMVRNVIRGEDVSLSDRVDDLKKDRDNDKDKDRDSDKDSDDDRPSWWKKQWQKTKTIFKKDKEPAPTGDKK